MRTCQADLDFRARDTRHRGPRGSCPDKGAKVKVAMTRLHSEAGRSSQHCQSGVCAWAVWGSHHGLHGHDLGAASGLHRVLFHAVKRAAPSVPDLPFLLGMEHESWSLGVYGVWELGLSLCDNCSHTFLSNPAMLALIWFPSPPKTAG